MPNYHATGITLLVHKYKGTQRIASFYTRECGKVEATVSGVGKPGGKLAPAVEPLTLSRLYFAEGRGMDRLTQCEVIDAHYPLRSDLHRLGLASYAAELLAKTTEPGAEDEALFDLFRETLAASTTSEQPALVVWSFVLKYLCMSGLGPVFDRCALCECGTENRGRYVEQVGGIVCTSCAGEGGQGMGVLPQTLGAMRSLLSLPPDRVDRIRLNPGLQGQVREVLRRHIRYHIGVDLKTESFLEKMARAGG